MLDELRFREKPRVWSFDIPWGPPRTRIHDNLRAASVWCAENLTDDQWDFEDQKIHIYNETAALAFKLRWC